MTARPFDSAVAAEYERVHVRYTCNGIPEEWDIVAPPDRCERCGTRVFAMRDRTGTVALFHVGWVRRGDMKCTASAHTPERCSAARRFGVSLEGRTPQQLQGILRPPADSANREQIGLFGESA